MIYDVAIIGAGPAGLLAGMYLEENGIDFIIIEKGKNFENRDKDNPFDVSYGFGGAGLYSDGKLSYPPSASKLWTTIDENNLKYSYEYVKKIFYESNIELSEWNPSWTNKYEYIEEKLYDSMYISWQERNVILNKLYEKLKYKILLDTQVSKINYVKDIYELSCNNKVICSKILIMATGKNQAAKLFSKDDIENKFFIAEMGIRVEVNNEEFLVDKSDQIDYKMISSIDKYTQLRTFCCCRKGIVRESLYDNHLTYNGEKEDFSQKSNIGIVLRTKNIESEYYKEIEKCYQNNNNKVLTIDDYMSGTNIIGYKTDNLLKTFLSKLHLDNCQGLVYGPEIEKFGYYPKLDKNLQCQNNVFYIGDATGEFRGLMAAFVSGVFVSKYICDIKRKNMRKYMEKLYIKQSCTDDMKMIFTAQSKAYFYCRDVVCQYVLEKGMLPINPFRVFDYFLSDRVDRDLIRQGNNQLIKKCDELWVFGQIADGVLFEIASAIEMGKKVRFFTIGTRKDDIKEIDIDNISFEPEVHSRKVKKSDLIDFIKNRNIKNEDSQISIFEIIK